MSHDETTTPLRPGTVLSIGASVGGTYRVLALLGAGGMGEVYEVEHERLHRRFALKILRGALYGKGLERFRREARAVARLESEHVVSAIDCGELADGTPYFVMERLRGRDLRHLLEDLGQLPIPRAVRLVQDACRGVAAAHRAGLVHRDLKPENLFVVERENGEELCKVLDFGVAKLEAASSTENGSLIGTVKYMAPEQLVDGSKVDARADDVTRVGIDRDRH
jgi:serine/threonine protein kinase